jgi:hypothetical protein
MTYFTSVSPTCQQEAKRHGQTAVVNNLAQRIELGQAIDNLEPLGKFRKKGLGKSYRLIIGVVYDQDDCLLVFWRVLPKSSKEYSSFCENPESFRHDFEVFCNTQNLEQVFREKRQSSEITQLRNLDEVERTYLYWPASHEVDEWLILESPEWVQRTDQETGPFSSYLSSLHDHVYNLAEKHPNDTETWDDKVGLLYRCLPEERLTYLIAPVKRGDTEDLERLRRQFQRELYAPIDAESLLRKSRRTYPELIVYEPELWIDRIQKESEKANLALSREEAEILRHQQDGYPLFINGRPGSGKSTVLQYLFADHLQQFMTDASMLGRPLYLTYSRDLLDIAKENVRSILTCNGRRLVSKGARNREEVEQSIEGCFADFRDFLFSLLPSVHRFVEDRYLSFPEFRLRFEERFSRHPNKHVRKITAELAWHVIRTYIKGMLSEQEEDYDVEHYKELPSKRKSLTDSTYEIVYQEIWLGWYRPLCEDEEYWDDQDLARRLLELATDDPESFDLARYPVIFCDEAQDFTKNELRLIYRLSLFSRRNLTPDILRRVPFAFAGDPFQTLNPTGFDWESTRTAFYEALVGQLDRAEKPTLELNYQELSFNYRSTRAIVQLCNFIHLVRGVAFGKRDLHPQRTYFDEAANMPVYFDVNSPVLQSKLRGQQEIVIIVPCQEGEELDYIQNDEFLSTIALSPDRTQIVRNILSPMRAKGQEFSRVVVYKFGEVCSTDYADLLELIDPQDQQRQMSPEQIIPAEYFINRLYVAASRAQKRLFIADTSKGFGSFWRFFEKEDPAVFVQRYREHVQQPRNAGQFTWHVDDLVKIQPGDQNSWEQDHDNPSDLAEEFYRSGLRTKDTYKLRLAIQNYQAAGIADKQRECEGWLLEFEGEFEKAGECFAEIGNRDKARRLFWKAGVFHRILEFGENSLENAASAFMLSPNTEPNGDSLVFLSELSQAIKDGLIQLDETWGKVIGTLLGYIIDRKPETDLQVHEWGNLSRIVEEFGRRGIYSRLDDRLLEQLRIRATPYPEKLGLLQKPGADPGVIADYYLAKSRVPLTDGQADIVFQSLLRLHNYDELDRLAKNYPSLRRLASLLAVFIQQDRQRVPALTQTTFVFMCDHNLWDAAYEFATKANLPVDEEARQVIRQHNWGTLLDELFGSFGIHVVPLRNDLM